MVLWSCFSEVKDELERVMYDVKRTANSVRTNLKGMQKISRLLVILVILLPHGISCRCRNNFILVGVEKCRLPVKQSKLLQYPPIFCCSFSFLQ